MNVWIRMVAVTRGASIVLVVIIAFVMLVMSFTPRMGQVTFLFLTVKLDQNLEICIPSIRLVSVSILLSANFHFYACYK